MRKSGNLNILQMYGRLGKLSLMMKSMWFDQKLQNS